MIIINGLNNHEKSHISITPNPIENQFSIHGLQSNQNTNIEILNLSGQSIFVFEGQKSDGQGKLMIDKNFKFNGLAIVKLQQNSQTISLPVVFNN